MKDHVAQQGECVSSIAFENGFFHQTVWDAPENADLKALRKSPFILQAGDVVHVPDLRAKELEVATGKRSVFRRKGVPETLNLRFVHDGKPRAGVKYHITIDGKESEGETDGDGRVRHFLPPNAREGKLVLFVEAGHPEEYQLQLRNLDPIETVSGQQARLKNLGLFAGEIDGAPSPELAAAIHAFQRRSSLPESDEPDAATRDALVAAHHS